VDQGENSRQGEEQAGGVILLVRDETKGMPAVYSGLIPFLFCESGGIGRRAGLRILCRKACGFDSLLSHASLGFLSAKGQVLTQVIEKHDDISSDARSDIPPGRVYLWVILSFFRQRSDK
jgi:hypothetical protein